MVKRNYKIILADDHPLLIRGLREVIEEENIFNIVDTASNGEQALFLIEHHRPDIAILDIDMPKMNGLEVAEVLFKKNHNTRIIFLTMHNKETIYYKTLELGASGYVMKDSALTEIVEALKCAADGKYYVSPSFAGQLLRRKGEKSFQMDTKTGISLLTPTEKKILTLVSEQRSSKEIADILSISYRTVETHRGNICDKLEIKGTNSLLKFALENKALL